MPYLQKKVQPASVFRNRQKDDGCLFQQIFYCRSCCGHAVIPQGRVMPIRAVQYGKVSHLIAQNVTGINRTLLSIIAGKENRLTVPIQFQPHTALAVPGKPPGYAVAFFIARSCLLQRHCILYNKRQLLQGGCRGKDRSCIALPKQPRQCARMVGMAMRQKYRF